MRKILPTSFIPAVTLALAVLIAIAAIAGCSQQEPSEQAADQNSVAAEAGDDGTASEASSDESPTSSLSADAQDDEESADDKDSELPDEYLIIQEAVDEALEEGKQVFTGTVRVTTYGERANEVDPILADSFENTADDELVLLVFDLPQKISACAAGDEGRISMRDRQSSIRIENEGDWADLEELSVVAAANAEDLTFPSDVSGALYSASGELEVLAAEPGDLPSVTIGNAMANFNTNYMLPDSSTYAYTREELIKLSNRELFIARNEIYARHGRLFDNEVLAEYFNLKSWYNGRISPDRFSDDMLNQIELDNIALILSIEESRNSEYL